MMISIVSILCLSIQFSLIQCQNIDQLVDQLRHLESFVELKGGHFRMGINDRDGINGEYPFKQTFVKSFRLTLFPFI